MRHQARTRRGGGIPPTKHRDANGGCSAREESSFSPKGATSMRRLGPAPEGAMRGFVSGRSRAEPSRVSRLRQDSPPAPEGVYVYAERGEGRRNRPLSQGEHGCPKQSRTMSGKPAQHRRLSSPKPKLAPPRPRHRYKSNGASQYYQTRSSAAKTGPSMQQRELPRTVFWMQA